MALQTDRYSYYVDWSPEDEAFIGRVVEFSLLAAHGDTPQEALDEIRFVVGSVISELEETGEPIPQPLSGRNYSGKLMLRMPRSLHRALVVEATREGVSLNQLVVHKLSQTTNTLRPEGASPRLAVVGGE